MGRSRGGGRVVGGGLRAAAREGVVDGVGERGLRAVVFGAGGRVEALLREEVFEKE